MPQEHSPPPGCLGCNRMWNLANAVRVGSAGAQPLGVMQK
jgi:hypothetical protein